jgi:hypothetical protein
VSCGDGAIDAANGEVCDGSNVGGLSCTNLGYRPPGSVGCLPTCLAFDVSGCSPPGNCGSPGPLGSKQCDGANLGGEDCLSLGYTGGALSCVSCTFDVSGCTL